jgi:hypothetical protein
MVEKIFDIDKPLFNEEMEKEILSVIQMFSDKNIAKYNVDYSEIIKILQCLVEVNKEKRLANKIQFNTDKCTNEHFYRVFLSRNKNIETYFCYVKKKFLNLEFGIKLEKLRRDLDNAPLENAFNFSIDITYAHEFVNGLFWFFKFLSGAVEDKEGIHFQIIFETSREEIETMQQNIKFDELREMYLQQKEKKEHFLFLFFKEIAKGLAELPEYVRQQNNGKCTIIDFIRIITRDSNSTVANIPQQLADILVKFENVGGTIEELSREAEIPAEDLIAFRNKYVKA